MEHAGYDSALIGMVGAASAALVLGTGFKELRQAPVVGCVVAGMPRRPTAPGPAHDREDLRGGPA